MDSMRCVRKFVDCINPIDNRVDQDPNCASTEERDGCHAHSNTAVIDLPLECEATLLNPDITDIPQTDSINNFFEQTNDNFNTGTSNYSVSSRLATKRRLRTSLFHIWDNHLSLKLFGTKKRIIEELERQENINHWVIHPCSKFRLIWDTMMLVILAINVILLPVTIAFFDDSINSAWITFSVCLDILFIVDVVLNFWTGIITKENIVYLEFNIIRPAYLKSWFLVDVLAVLPFDYVALIAVHIQSSSLIMPSRALRALRLLRLLSLLKLVRVARFMRYLAKWEEFINTTKPIMRIINLVVVMVMLAHWNGCIQFLVPYIQDFPHNSWVVINRLKDQHIFIQYTWAVFKATSHMICIGYGRFPPQNTVEVWITIISMLIGASFYAVFIGHISTIVYSADSASRQYSERIKQVDEYMRYRRIPNRLKEQVHEYFYHKYHGQLFDEENILNELSHPLKERIVSHNCQDLIKIVPFFEDASEAFINCMTTRLKFEVFLPGDYIIRQGTFGSKMYFIQQGTVDVLLPNGKLATSLYDGSYFGEICLLMKCRRVSSVKAVSTCDLYALSNNDFQHVLDEFPNMRIRLEGVAKQRLAMISSSRDLLSNESTMTSTTPSPQTTTTTTTTKPQTTGTQTTTQSTTTTKSSNNVLSRKLSTSALTTLPNSTSALISTFASTETTTDDSTI